jgi:hypothetical protein
MTTYNLFAGTPQTGATADPQPVSVGTEFRVSGPAWLTEVRFLQPSAGTIDAQPRTAGLYTIDAGDRTGTLVAGPFTIPAPGIGAWGKYALLTAYKLTAGVEYKMVVFHPGGQYGATPGYFNGADQTIGPITEPGGTNATLGAQGSYSYGPGMMFPTSFYNNTAYYADATISDTDPALAGHHYTVTARQDPPRWVGVQDKSRFTARQDAPRWVGVQDG